MRYEYICENKKCMVKDKPFEFEGDQPLSKYKDPIDCPKCNSKKDVKKVMRTAFPTSQSWRTF